MFNIILPTLIGKFLIITNLYFLYISLSKSYSFDEYASLALYLCVKTGFLYSMIYMIYLPDISTSKLNILSFASTVLYFLGSISYSFSLYTYQYGNKFSLMFFILGTTFIASETIIWLLSELEYQKCLLNNEFNSEFNDN